MKVKTIVSEDFVNYRQPSMFIGFPTCTFKCEKESGCNCCQNSELVKSKTHDVLATDIVTKYTHNPITSAIVCGGLEPFDSFEDLLSLIQELRKYTDDTIVIYTGYNESEIVNKTTLLSSYKNIIVKFGRYIPNSQSRYDELLGVTLASDNQYAKQIS